MTDAQNRLQRVDVSFLGPQFLDDANAQRVGKDVDEIGQFLGDKRAMRHRVSPCLKHSNI